MVWKRLFSQSEQSIFFLFFSPQKFLRSEFSSEGKERGMDLELGVPEVDAKR